MNKTMIKSIFLMLTVLPAILPATARTEQAQTTATIVFSGSSTLHDFEGTVSTPPFTAVFSKDPETGQTLVSATATVPVMGMDTQNGKRDKKMFKMLDEKNYALISGSIANVPLPVKNKGDGESPVDVELTIQNKKQTVKATLSEWERDGNRVSGTLTFPVSLKAFGLKAPSVMKLIRVADTVNIKCKLEGTIQ